VTHFRLPDGRALPYRAFQGDSGRDLRRIDTGLIHVAVKAGARVAARSAAEVIRPERRELA
jgi:hypothetical protein